MNLQERAKVLFDQLKAEIINEMSFCLKSERYEDYQKLYEVMKELLKYRDEVLPLLKNAESVFRKKLF
jgi:hypothetical protein